MRKFLLVIVVLLVVLVAGVIFARNFLAKSIIEKAVEHVAGVDIKIDRVNLDLLNTNIEVKGIELLNPRGFETRLLANVPELFIDYDLKALFFKKIHLYQVKLNLKELFVEKNELGELNIHSPKKEKASQLHKEEKEVVASRKAPALEFNIDVLELTISKAIFKDYSQGRPPVVREFHVNIEKAIFRNVSDPKEIMGIITTRVLVNTAIAKLTSLGPETIEEDLEDVLKKGADILKQTLEDLEKKLGFPSSE